tara:strand:+ start:7460 stop:7864 length:405 start_codon:yes stop_codon:yes gene_type:complete
MNLNQHFLRQSINILELSNFVENCPIRKEKNKKEIKNAENQLTIIDFIEFFKKNNEKKFIVKTIDYNKISIKHKNSILNFLFNKYITKKIKNTIQMLINNNYKDKIIMFNEQDTFCFISGDEQKISILNKINEF